MDEAYLDLTGDVRPDYDIRALKRAEESDIRALKRAEESDIRALKRAEESVLGPGSKDTAQESMDEEIDAIMALPQSASELIETIRQQVFERIGIRASAGIGPSVLLARLCTRKAKPNGQYSYCDMSPQGFVDNADVTSLPGVGWSTAGRLRAMKITQCEQLRALSLADLQAEFGERNGLGLFRASRGLDMSVLKGNQPPKSVSVEISWGVRFEQDVQVVEFIKNLAKEVTQRLQGVGRKGGLVPLCASGDVGHQLERPSEPSTNGGGMQVPHAMSFVCRAFESLPDFLLTGKRITLKIKQKQADVTAPYKMLGHGPCDDRNRTATLPHPTDDVEVVAAACLEMSKHMQVPAVDVRGVGISIHQLAEQDQGDIAKDKHVKMTSFFKQQPGQSMPPPKRPASSTDRVGTATTKLKAGNQRRKQGKLDHLARSSKDAQEVSVSDLC
jgi:DNA repair protein REV1